MTTSSTDSHKRKQERKEMEMGRVLIPVFLHGLPQKKAREETKWKWVE
jgi:hypothetical protein